MDAQKWNLTGRKALVETRNTVRRPVASEAPSTAGVKANMLVRAMCPFHSSDTIYVTVPLAAPFKQTNQANGLLKNESRQQAAH